MFVDGQRIERDQVEARIAAAFPYPYFKAIVSEREEPNHIRVITTITGPDGTPLSLDGKQCTYFALKANPNILPQIEADWTA